MLTIRSTATAIILTGLAGGPSFAATCNLTTPGLQPVDDEECTVIKSGTTTRIIIGSYGTITVRGSVMSAQVFIPPSVNGRGRVKHVPLGSVLYSPDVEDKTCFAGQQATLCFE